jgi:hypothetical protein
MDAYLRSQRQQASPFDVAFAGVTEATKEAAVIQPYAQAVASWWLEGIWVERGTVQQMRERIRQRSPTIDLLHKPD